VNLPCRSSFPPNSIQVNCMTRPPTILLTNDDGVESIGLLTLAEELDRIADVWIVAPSGDRSGASHALTTRSPVRMVRAERLGRQSAFAVDGTPADCVYLALSHVLRDSPPALVISGVNDGYNLADDISYSGTVAAALEAALLDVPAIAVSVESFRGTGMRMAIQLARELAVHSLANVGAIPRGSLLNVNVPAEPRASDFRVTTVGRRAYSKDVRPNVDPRGRAYYWIGGAALDHENLPGSDCNAVIDDRVISVSPLHVQASDERGIAVWSAVTLSGFRNQAT